MLINPNELPLKQAADRCQALLSSKKVLVCSKNRLTLTALCLCTPILQSLIGGATTEEEGLDLQLKFNPDLLITSEDLEKGYGIRLVERVKTHNPKITALIFLGRETTDVVHEAMDAGADFIKTSTGKISPAATPPVVLTMLEAIRDFKNRTGKKIGMKPAGGISNAKLAIQYLVMVKETLGNDWLSPNLFRFGASSLANDVLMQIAKQMSGHYQSKDYFSID